MTRLNGILLAALLTSGLAGCSVNEVVTAEETALVVAESPRDESQLLDIGIVQFDEGLPPDNDPAKTNVYDDIRAAESTYLAYHLKTTLQETGHWGAVRVVPLRNAFTDVLLSGEIEESDGEFVTLKITASDARGVRWFTREYRAQTGVSSYAQTRDRRQDPYQKVFNDIANDLQVHASTLPTQDVTAIRQVSELQFFADMAPAQFGGHLETDNNGITRMVRLPAANDPSVARLRQIRERDRLVVDTLNEHYANFYYGIAIPYNSWRKTSREESINFRQVRRSATMQTLMGAVVIAGSLAIDTDSGGRQTRNVNRSLQNIGLSQGLENVFGGFSRRSEASMHMEAIQELAESFGAEAAPMVVDVEGQTRRLTGTAASQYESWRRLIKDIYEAETGFVETQESSAATLAPDPGP